METICYLANLCTKIFIYPYLKLELFLENGNQSKQPIKLVLRLLESFRITIQLLSRLLKAVFFDRFGAIDTCPWIYAIVFVSVCLIGEQM